MYSDAVFVHTGTPRKSYRCSVSFYFTIGTIISLLFSASNIETNYQSYKSRNRKS